MRKSKALVSKNNEAPKAASKTAAKDFEKSRTVLIQSINHPLFAESLFDHVPDVVFSMKDRQGRYICISNACLNRLGIADRSEALGRTAHDLFPAYMADRYVAQDEQLFRTGKPITDNLDVTLYKNRSPGWCLTTKIPLRNHQGELVALACISKDLIDPSINSLVDERFARTIDYIHASYASPLRIPDLAKMAGLSSSQFERRMKSIFLISAVHFLIKTRIHHASLALAHDDRSISDIALSCGFCDQSALTRQFKQLTGLTPKAYRTMMRGDDVSE